MRVTIATDGFLEENATPAMRHDCVFARHDDVKALVNALTQSDALVTRRASVTPDLLRAAPRLKLVQQVGAGTDRIDLAGVGALGISVANTPGATSNSVVEHTFLLVLAMLRGLVTQVDAMRKGGWSGAEVWQSEEIAGKTVGILGFGSIGRDLARRFAVFGANVLVNTRTIPAITPADVTFVDLPSLLRACDVLIVAVSLTDATRGLLDRSRLEMLRPGALVVNVARGAVIDEEAFIDLLREGRLRAALDAYAKEPLAIGSPLRQLANVLPTPHSAGSSGSSRDRIWQQMLDNLDRLADGRALVNVVNQDVLVLPH